MYVLRQLYLNKVEEKDIVKIFAHFISSQVPDYFSVSKMLLKFLHVFLWFESSFIFLLMNNILLYGCTNLYIHSPMEKHLDCFQVLAKAATNIHVQDFVCTLIFKSLGKY